MHRKDWIRHIWLSPATPREWANTSVSLSREPKGLTETPWYLASNTEWLQDKWSCQRCCPYIPHTLGESLYKACKAQHPRELAFTDRAEEHFLPRAKASLMAVPRPPPCISTRDPLYKVRAVLWQTAWPLLPSGSQLSNRGNNVLAFHTVVLKGPSIANPDLRDLP